MRMAPLAATCQSGGMRMKVSSGRAKPEFDDVARVAAKTGASPREVASRAEEAWRANRPAATAPPDGTPA